MSRLAYIWPMSTLRKARIFRNGRNQAVRIPREMEFSEKDVLIYREGSRLIIEPVGSPPRLEDLLATLTRLEDPWPDVDEGLGVLDDIRL